MVITLMLKTHIILINIGKRDNMGQTYKRYLDVIENINDSNLSKEEKEQETERAKTERKNAYLERGYSVKQIERMPPWSSV